MKQTLFGTLPSGEAVECITLENSDATLEILTFGGAIRNFEVYGHRTVGGFDTLEAYLKDDSHQGAIIGRVANRIANARFSLDGVEYPLTPNNGKNCLHGGRGGFDRRVWSVKDTGEDFVTLTYVSADMEEGFPGCVSVEVTYRLVGTAIRIDYTARTDKRTPVALTNHSYFSLSDFGGRVESYTAEIYADAYSEIDEDMIPVARRAVAGTFFDFTTPHTIGERITEDFGYDHSFFLAGKTVAILGDTLTHAARVASDTLALDVYTDAPCVQFYIGNFLGNGEPFFTSIPSKKRTAFCLETQTEPNAVNHGEIILSPGDTYRHTTVYAISRV